MPWGYGRRIIHGSVSYSLTVIPPLVYSVSFLNKRVTRHRRHFTRKFPCRLHLKCDGTRAETRFRLSAKRASPFKSAGASVQSTTGSLGVRISSSNTGYTMFRGSVKGTGYPLHSPVSPSLPLQCVTVCNHISTNATERRPLPRKVQLAKKRHVTVAFTIAVFPCSTSVLP
jgi:hypothetical protein